MHKHDQFIEQLSEIATLQCFLALSSDYLAEYVGKLTHRVFHKTDFALHSVVNSLFEHQGPLAELTVQLKLLLGLGVISATLYEDIIAFTEFKGVVNTKIDEIAFIDNDVIHFAQRLHNIDLTVINELRKQQGTHLNQDSMLFQLQQLRLERVIRSSLILTLTKILEQLDIDSPL